MEIIQLHQYNQAIGKYKLLSSTSGVGSIITTKMGYYILVSDINKWKFINKAQHIIDEIRKEESDEHIWYDRAKIRINGRGLSFVDDKRFTEFLKSDGAMGLSNLVCLIGIPTIAINETSNTPNWKEHPISKRLKELDEESKAEDFMVMGTHFPKWFINSKKKLKEYKDWKKLWISKNQKSYNFVPPRDATSPVKDSSGTQIVIKLKDKDGVEKSPIPLFKKLRQTNLILICPNGHLSDIPWSSFLRWKSERVSNDDIGINLFDLEKCCPSPELEWSESTTKSDGYGSIFIECKSCGLGGINKINLEGINNIKPLCKGEKPWEIDLKQDGNIIPYENCENVNQGRCRECNSTHTQPHMRVSLVTGNSVYYATGFSSLYIPQHLAENINPILFEGLKRCEAKYERYLKAFPEKTKAEYWEKLDKKDFIIDNGFIENGKILLNTEDLKKAFLDTDENDLNNDKFELYRWQEYKCFVNNSIISDSNENEGLSFCDIELNGFLSSFFNKIQQVEELKVTQVQVDFSRVKPKERIIIGSEVIVSSVGKHIFSKEPNDVFVIPANETFGEGLFFQFDEDKIQEWIKDIDLEGSRFQRFFKDQDLTSQGAAIKQQIKNNGIKHFLIHSFSHMLMRELEFRCGYPTASLKERLYISNNPSNVMSGVLIYTAEGSEGSMGGLVWQGNPENIEGLIRKGLERANDCSSDPLCWESDGQGVFDLNLSACFSCSLVSETACESMNLGLDRRVLIDDHFGYFKEIES